ncbi:hypothetical protein ABBQ38_000574 [Trebouxia sp. C0009 RCD-2024]
MHSNTACNNRSRDVSCSLVPCNTCVCTLPYLQQPLQYTSAQGVLSGLPSAEELPKDRAEQLGVTFNKLQVQFLQDHGPFIYISMMGVRPDMQRQGLGGLLLAAMCSVADEERKWCYLEATHAGIGLYQKHGFVVVCTSQIGPEAPVMQHMGRPPQ